MSLEDLKDAKHTDLRHRFLRGGLPPFFLAERFPERDFQEWMGAYCQGQSRVVPLGEALVVSEIY